MAPLVERSVAMGSTRFLQCVRDQTADRRCVVLGALDHEAASQIRHFYLAKARHYYLAVTLKRDVRYVNNRIDVLPRQDLTLLTLENVAFPT
jgi:hypothetical protein